MLAHSSKQASTQPPAAQVHYAAGERAFSEAKYDEAAAEFAAAYDLSHQPALLYNIAQSYRLGGHFREAAAFYDSMLRELPTTEQHPEISGRIAEMEEREAAQIRAAQREEQERARPTRQLSETDTANSPSSHPGRALEIGGYTLCGVAAAGLALGAASSVLAVHASHSVQAAATPGHGFGSSLQSAQSRGMLDQKLEVVGYALAGASAVGAVTTLALGFRADKRQRELHGTWAARLIRSVSASASAHAASIGIRGVF